MFVFAMKILFEVFINSGNISVLSQFNPAKSRVSIGDSVNGAD